MKIPEVERMAPLERRRFLSLLSAGLASPLIAPGLRYAIAAVAGGEAYAQTAAAELPTHFIEIDLRDQWDQGHVFVAPGLATYGGLRRGTTGDRAALFFSSGELRQRPNNAYLTADSAPLDPHLDTIAMIDCCELSRGAIHGHEAANPLRSPGRDYVQKPGAMPMYLNDPVSNFPQGCEAYYSTTPTPASLHNAHQKTLDPEVRNGVAFKGISRSVHTCYHFAAGLPAGELDRKQSVDSLLAAFPDRVEDLSILPRPEDADALVRIAERADRRFLAERAFTRMARTSHEATLAEAKKLLHTGAVRAISLSLTAEERAFWSAGVPDQVGGNVKAQIWEQVAYGFKIVSSGMARTVALEFDYADVHDMRTESQVRTEAKQVALPLSRLIARLKEAGIYDRTLVAIYTVDGSRSPAASSYGNEGKNTVILAGGMIRGGYYGDVRVAGNTDAGHVYSFHAPDPTTGAPGPGRTDNGGRLPGAAVWRTVMKALRVPDAACDRFADVRGVAPLPFLLRG